MARAYVGTSGWSYDAWRDDFYEDVPKKKWLSYCAENFDTLEINASFYQLQQESTFESWREETPDGFPFALKGHRYITHSKRLNDIDEAVQNSHENAAPLGDQLAVVLWQFPDDFSRDEETVEARGMGAAHRLVGG